MANVSRSYEEKKTASFFSIHCVVYDRTKAAIFISVFQLFMWHTKLDTH